MTFSSHSTVVLCLFFSWVSLPLKLCLADTTGVIFVEQLCESDASFRGLSVVDSRVAWCSGTDGTVLRTVNAGRTWKDVSIEASPTADFRDIQAFDKDTAVAMSAGTPGLVFRTSDGGMSWEQVYKNSDPKIFFDAMAFTSDGHGFGFSDPIDGRLPIIETSDEGRTWILSAHGPRAVEGEAGFAASGTCMAVIGDNIWIGLGGRTANGKARVMRSIDKGKTWSVAETPITSTKSSGVFSLVFTDAFSGVAVGGDYKAPEQSANCVAVTRDGGRTWKAANETGVTGFRACVGHASIGDNGLLVAVGRNGGDYSTNGGDNWTPIKTQRFNAVAFDPSPGNPVVGWAVGPDGQIAKCEFTNPDEPRRYSAGDFASVEKVDMHTHIHTDVLDFVAMGRRDEMRFLSMAVHNRDAKQMQFLHRTTYFQHRANPDQIAAVVSFPMKGWDEPDWQANTIKYLDDAIARGAIGVKVWKNIGMEFRDKKGDLVMIDHPQFDAVIDHIRKRNMVLIAHLGEPKNCWLPLEQMTVNNDRSYFEENPKYHMFKHPEMPSYEDQIAARDRMLAKHPNLNFVGAHLASLEWSTDAMAEFLERSPNATIGCAARIGQIQYQSQRDRQKVIDFFTKYQDRIMYGTDLAVGPKDLASEVYEKAKKRWLSEWRYFNTAEQIEIWELDEPVQGLRLPKSIVDKIYWQNAKRVFANSWPHVPL